MSPPNDESHLYEQFKFWLHRPDAVPRREGADTAPAEALIEDAMWAAYRAGYRQAAADCDGAQRLAGALKNCTKEKR